MHIIERCCFDLLRRYTAAVALPARKAIDPPVTATTNKNSDSLFMCQRCQQLLLMESLNPDDAERLYAEAVESLAEERKQRSSSDPNSTDQPKAVFLDDQSHELLMHALDNSASTGNANAEQNSDEQKLSENPSHATSRTSSKNFGNLTADEQRNLMEKLQEKPLIESKFFNTTAQNQVFPLNASISDQLLFNTTEVERDPRVKLFTLLSGTTEIDHPLCEACCDSLIYEMERVVRTSEEEKRELEQFLTSYDLSSTVLGHQQHLLKKPMSELETELHALQAQQQAMHNEQQYLETQVGQAEKTFQALQTEHDQLEREKYNFYGQRAKLSKQMFDTQDDLESLERQISVAEQRLAKLSRTNVFNEAFHILPQDQFGTINGLRLGRLKNVTPPVEWTEINAAWGETALLLHCLARKVSLDFERYELAPYGSYSFIRPCGSAKQILPLYNSVSYRVMPDTKFDEAMRAFLDLLAQLKYYIENRDPNFRLPYDIDVKAGKILDANKPASAVSIKLQFNPWEQWTRALKWVLTNLKWAMTWVAHLDAASSNVSNSSDGELTVKN